MYHVGLSICCVIVSRVKLYCVSMTYLHILWDPWKNFLFDGTVEMGSKLDSLLGMWKKFKAHRIWIRCVQSKGCHRYAWYRTWLRFIVRIYYRTRSRLFSLDLNWIFFLRSVKLEWNSNLIIILFKTQHKNMLFKSMLKIWSTHVGACVVIWACWWRLDYFCLVQVWILNTGDTCWVCLGSWGWWLLRL